MLLKNLRRRTFCNNWVVGSNPFKTEIAVLSTAQLNIVVASPTSR